MKLFSITSDLPSDQDLKSLPHFPRTALTLVDYLGSGAFGNVYAGEARDIHGPGTGTVTVAVKTLQPNASGLFVSSFVCLGLLVMFTPEKLGTFTAQGLSPSP